MFHRLKLPSKLTHVTRLHPPFLSNMLARFWTRLPDGASVLEDLKALAITGDLEKFTSCMQKWDTVKNTKWAELDTLEFFSLVCRDDVPNVKAVVLHRVLTAAAGAGKVNIVEYLMEQRGCVVYPAAVRAALGRERWAVLELFLKDGWDINSAVEGNNSFPILKCVSSLVGHGCL